MKVILRKNIKGVGTSGAIIDVSDGYARNYLLPRQLAHEATAGNLAQAAQAKAAQAKRDEKLLAEAKELAARLAGAPIRVTAKAGERGKIFGAVTNAQVADALKNALGIDIDRHKIEMAEPIKTTGDHKAVVKLPLGVTAQITVRVTPQ
ncbi:MAG: 50S ribosomal protein L9 [Candidatus Eremiobacteraeota bacterium]|nr:50S ribosomal protein L9 [Candidatus Eremiobacteraeota bacterium]MBV8204190.1 50S ribosomal protein L9 [Candidatus Eremiobacteraeota bacterium]MBV8263052.1 50S ribosomal protein L9 [Candidatus Eremiobacteraeota bacterium]MBV8340534.1 50S ribosomal protein L9 [Candidatus Eremiobacteraeota bacterium]MBV8459483.1 50S ribosomal protein L9 [Candidatus Eremiobacteraeota bacterium]